MRHLDLFSGIGGAAIAVDAVWPGSEHIFCEIDPFCQAILKKHWPNSEIHDDIKTFKGTKYAGTDILTGGFPCQPFSAAGKRRGTEDDRHLWPEMLRVIRESRPRWIVGENVGGILTWNRGMVLERVIADLEAESYEVWPFIIPACSKNAPHKRDRVWIIANANRSSNGRIAGKNAGEGETERIQERDEMGESGKPDTIRVSSDSPRVGFGRRRNKKHGTQKRELVSMQQKGNKIWSEDERCDWNAWPEVATRLCTLDDGLSGGLVRPKGWRNAALKGAGNAWVPQVAIEIMKAIKLNQ